MKIVKAKTSKELGSLAGKMSADIIRKAIDQQGYANIILATGTSQFETLNQLVRENGIDWSKVTLFHLDEYIGLPLTHPASFRKYLQERFLQKVFPLKKVFLIDGEINALEEIKKLNFEIKNHPIDVALVGIGENGHLAFNDPPADFETDEPYLTVNLDELCRKQQMNEGWFDSLKNVPKQAISMSIKQIMKSRYIICSVPDKRKAIAVKKCLEQEITNQLPASILQLHPECTLFLDKDSAELLIKNELQ